MKKIILSIITLIAFLPSIVLAEELTPDYEWYGTGVSTTYEISDVDDLLGFANIVNGKAEGIAYLEEQLATLTDPSALEDYLPTEGITFLYKNKMYKLTGYFQILNNICGYFKYKRK